jgi:hypothetical protein
VNHTAVIRRRRRLPLTGGGPPPPPSLPLDSFTTVFRACSVARRLRTAHTGPLLRVRRSGDSLERDIRYTAADVLDSATLTGFCGINSIPNSENITTVAGWTLAAVTTALNGTANGDSIWRVGEDTTNAKHRIGTPSITAAAGQSFTVSYEVRAAGAPLFQILFGSTISLLRANFDLDNLTTNFNTTSASIIDLGDGWRRITASVIVGSAGGTTFLQFIQSMSDGRDPAVYVGNTARAVDVRRASVQVGTTASGYCPTTGTAITALQDGFVPTLYCQSGLAINMANATATQQPGIVTAGVINLLNGVPTLTFNGTSQHLVSTTTGLYAAGQATVVAALRGNTSTNSMLLSESSSSSATPFYAPMATSSTTATTAAAVLRNDGNSLILNAITPLAPLAYNNTPRVLTSRDTGSQVEMFLDGTLAGSTSYARAGTLTVDRQGLGALVRPTVGNFWAGSVTELVAFTSALSTGDRQTYERNLGSFTGITVA